MHPDVRQIGPGACPICGMALEPEAGGADDGGELADMTRRLWISAVLTLPVAVLAMGEHFFGFAPLSHRASGLVQLALATPVVLWGGWPFFVRGAQSLRTRHLNMFTLIAMGTGVAYGYSVVATFAPQLFPSDVRQPARRCCALFRGGRRHYRLGADGTGVGVAGAGFDFGGHSRADGAYAQ